MIDIAAATRKEVLGIVALFTASKGLLAMAADKFQMAGDYSDERQTFHCLRSCFTQVLSG